MWKMVSAVQWTVLRAFPVLILSLSYWTYLKYKYRKITSVEEEPEDTPSVHEILFFTDKGSVCRAHVSEMLPCQLTDGICIGVYLWKMVNYIEQAKETLEVCIYHMTCHDFYNAIYDIHANGKKVRVIADADMIRESGSQIRRLKRSGVPVRMKKSWSLMHHKFLIIDKKILLTGSANWTMQAFAGNWENMIITSDSTFVCRFSEEFENLWKDFDV